MSNNLKPISGQLFRAQRSSGALTTNPFGIPKTETITTKDHTTIDQGVFAILLQITLQTKSGIWIWLIGENIVWQIMSLEIFEKCWKEIDTLCL